MAAEPPSPPTANATSPPPLDRAAVTPHRSRAVIGRIFSANETVLVGVLIVLALAIQLRNPNFLSADNLTDIARAVSFMLIVAVAQTLVLISGGLDLSVGSVYALGGMAAALAINDGVPVVPALLIGVLCGAIVGAINGVLVVTFKVPALITTLGTLYAVNGVVLAVSGGNPRYGLPPSFVQLGQGRIIGIPVPVWIAGIVVVLGHLLLAKTVFGRRVYAVGGSERAAYLAGVPISRVRFSVFVISGTAAALAGVLIAARVGSAQVNAGSGLELQVIAATIIGGTSLFGGAGNVLGTLLGALLIAVIANGMVLAGISPFYQNIIVGAIIVIAVGLDGWRRRQVEAG